MFAAVNVYEFQRQQMPRSWLHTLLLGTPETSRTLQLIRPIKGNMIGKNKQ